MHTKISKNWDYTIRKKIIRDTNEKRERIQSRTVRRWKGTETKNDVEKNGLNITREKIPNAIDLAQNNMIRK